MNEPEYIAFTFSDKTKFENCKKVFNQIVECKNEKEKRAKEFWLKITPQYAVEYLKVSEKNKSWSLINLYEFIIEDLDVRFIDFNIDQTGIGRLDFEAGGYPYGGPSSLITFLRAFDCVAIETDEGANIFKINWSSNLEFSFDAAEKKEKGIKAYIKRLMK
ncbi:MAG: hypothetical protein JXQ93_13190 [Flavobacteriaceae bacterium]